jgi:hypothetical protein
MIMGWHGAALKFVKKYQPALSHKPVAFFLTAMNLTQTGEKSIGTMPIYVDPALAKPPKNAKRLSLKERYATVAHYLRPVLEAAPLVKPVIVGLFGGKLELYRLPLLQMCLFSSHSGAAGISATDGHSGLGCLAAFVGNQLSSEKGREHESSIHDFISNRIAVVGVRRWNQTQFELAQRGHQVFAVHSAQKRLWRPAVPT